MNTSIHNNAKTMAAFAVATAMGAAFHASANNTTYYVSPGGSDSNDGLSWATAFATAAKGFSMANTGGGNTGNNGNTVMIAAGTYQLTDAIGCTGASYEGGRTRVLGATENPEDVVLRGKGDREVLRLNSGVTVANLTIENGTNEGRTYRAAGVRVGAETGAAAPTQAISIVSNCVIRGCHNAYLSDTLVNNSKVFGGPVVVHNNGLLVDCVVSNNTAAYRGCGVTLGGAYAKALRCVITGNSATASDAGASVLGANNDFKVIGGGQLIDCTVSDNVASVAPGALNVPVVSGCTFENNRSQQNDGGDKATYGGGLSLTDYSATVSDCIFRDNASDYGAGVDVVNGSASFTNCLFEGNTARYGGGGAVVATGSNVSFNDCRFFGNRTTETTGGNNYGGGGILLYKQTTVGWCSVSNSVFGSNETGGRGGAFSHEWNAYCQAAIENCVFTNNVSYRQGGAICLREDSSHKHTDKVATIRNCLVVGNRTTGPSEAAATAGGILLVTYNDVEVANCTVVSNVASYVHNTNSGGGIYQRWGGRVINCITAFNKYGGSTDDADSWTSSSGTFLNCCSYPRMPGLFTEANGCINDDPKFTDAANGDFTLQRGSPCRNAGRALDWMAGAFDLSGTVARISESKPDIGCYESREMSTRTVLIFH